MNKFLKTSVAASLALASPVLLAGVEYSADVSSVYVWRGVDQNNGNASASGSIGYSSDSGVYASIWSGSVDGGAEVDISAGWAGDVAGVSVDVGAIYYSYPTNKFNSLSAGGSEDAYTSLDVVELALGISTGGFSLGIYNNMDSEVDEPTYISLGYEAGAYGVTLGTQGDYTHLDLGYTATDNLSFNLSYMVAQADNDPDAAPILSATYSF